MRKVRKGLLVLISGLIIVLLAAGTAWAQSGSASASATGAAGQAGGTFIEGTVNNMRTVNPWKAIESPEYEVLALNFDLLENFDKSTLQAAPGVAESWTQSSDGMTWTFNIRPNMTWQDGQPFTADDIAWTYNKTIDCSLGNSLDYLVPDFTDSITATSPTTLEWKTNVPTSAPVRPPWVYIATALALDDEMSARIAKHKADRGNGWSTIEEPIELARAVAEAQPQAPLVIDCITFWLSNLMLGAHDVDSAVARFVRSLDERKAPTFVVSCEVGGGLVPETPLGRAFRDEAGLVNQQLAVSAHQVLLMVAGLAMPVKVLP